MTPFELKGNENEEIAEDHACFGAWGFSSDRRFNSYRRWRPHGNWSGNWNCPGGEIKNGKLHGNLTQNGDKVEGTWTLVNTVEGTITGHLSGTAKGGMFIGNLPAGGSTIHFDGTYTDNKISGKYSSPIGNGGFTVTK